MKKFLLTLGLCASAVQAQTNLVQNGSFEQGMTNWTVMGVFKVVNDPVLARDGSHLIQLHTNYRAAPATLMQRIATIPGHAYECYMDVISKADVDDYFVQRVEMMMIGNTNVMQLLADQPGSTNYSFLYHSKVYFADSTNTLVQIRDASPVGYSAVIYVDNVTVYEPPAQNPAHHGYGMLPPGEGLQVGSAATMPKSK